MADPMVPRHPSGSTGELAPDHEMFDLFRSIGTLLRLLVVAVLCLMLLYGVYCAIDVFGQVGGLLKDPARLKEPVDSLATIIHADQLTVTINDEKVGFGRVVAIVLLGFGHLLWAWIPLLIISVSTRLLIAIVSPKKQDTP